MADTENKTTNNGAATGANSAAGGDGSASQQNSNGGANSSAGNGAAGDENPSMFGKNDITPDNNANQGSQDGKKEDGKKGDAAAGDGKNKPAALTEADIKLKDGFTLGEGGVKVALEKLNSLGITDKAQAQKAIDMFAEELSRIDAKYQAEKKTAWSDTVKQWGAETKADKEVGGQNFQANREFALRAIRELGDQSFKDAAMAGFANHPGTFKFLVKVGKMLSEDTPTQNNTGGKTEKSLGDTLFPDAPKSRIG